MAPSKHPRLPWERQQQIVAAIRAGSYPHVAAQAFGVPADVFERWLARGRAKRARAPLRAFAREVQAAHAQARLKAEMAVLQEAPRIWLEHGPGRDHTDNPGWSAPVKSVLVTEGARNLLSDPGIARVIQAVQDEVRDQPELRRRLGAILQQEERRQAA